MDSCPSEQARRRYRSGPSGRPGPPSEAQVARVRALLALLYPPSVWPSGPPLGAAAELARRVGGAASTADAVRRVLAGTRAVSEATLCRWERALGH